MEQQNNNIETTTTENETINAAAPNTQLPKEEAIWNSTLGEVEEWQIARQNLNAWLDEAEQGTFGQYFESKNQRSAPFSYQNLAIICHTSSGYIGDKVKKAKENGMKAALDSKQEYNEKLTLVSMILDCLAPNLAEERAKREAERQAKLAERIAKRAAVEASIASIRETWEQFDIPATAENIRKIAPKTLAKENGAEIVWYLSYEVLTPNEAHELVKELNVNTCEDIYSNEV
jgi:hypothetical protein